MKIISYAGAKTNGVIDCGALFCFIRYNILSGLFHKIYEMAHGKRV